MTRPQTTRGAVRTAQIIASASASGWCDARACEIQVALTHMARDRAVDASRSTDEKSGSTPHAARAGAPREFAGCYACAARAAGVGVRAQPLHLVATTTRRAVGRRNPHRVRAR
ncbi:hypothetical protein FB451DRAFT_1408026 [Mycena latifolia]|nr:hypothetical protein FB451DRAFT_1408026 [Mycena latifolia]